jgi:pantothenate synthetase
LNDNDGHTEVTEIETETEKQSEGLQRSNSNSRMVTQEEKNEIEHTRILVSEADALVHGMSQEESEMTMRQTFAQSMEAQYIEFHDQVYM